MDDASLTTFFVTLAGSIFVVSVVSTVLLGRLRPNSRLFKAAVVGSVGSVISAWSFLTYVLVTYHTNL